MMKVLIPEQDYGDEQERQPGRPRLHKQEAPFNRVRLGLCVEVLFCYFELYWPGGRHTHHENYLALPYPNWLEVHTTNRQLKGLMGIP